MTGMVILRVPVDSAIFKVGVEHQVVKLVTGELGSATALPVARKTSRVVITMIAPAGHEKVRIPASQWQDEEGI